MTKKAETAVETPSVATFSKEQILKSARYSARRDLLTAILKSGKKYSHDDVARLIDTFMKGQVK